MRQPFSIQSNTSIRTTFANSSYYYTKGAPSIPYFNFRSKFKIVHFLLYFYNKNYKKGARAPSLQHRRRIEAIILIFNKNIYLIASS